MLTSASNILGIITFLILLYLLFRVYLPSSHAGKVDKLWSEVRSTANRFNLTGQYLLKDKSLETIIQWCKECEPSIGDYIDIDDQNTINELSKIIKKYKARAEYLKKWWSYI